MKAQDLLGALLLLLAGCGVDADGDGYKANLDCDDANADIHPGATEVCNGIDDDCDDAVDDEDSAVDTSGGGTFYADADQDGFGDPTSPVTACEMSAGYTTDNTDCNDTTDLANPDAPEICDDIDNDCDDKVDDADDSVDLSTGSTFWVDGDGDGHGWVDSSGRFCQAPSGYSDLDDDCNDSDDSIHPGAVDIPQDGVDQDCSGEDAPYSLADLVEGDLIISEFMKDPAKVDDTLGEWFEVYNNTGGTLDLDGLYVADDGADSFTVSGALVVEADDFVVFGNNGDSGTNGGVTVDYSYGGAMSLGNADDQIVLADSSAMTTVYDQIAYNDGFPDGAGASAQLGAESLDATDNDDGKNWCPSTGAYGDGDLGTPGAPNVPCSPRFNIGKYNPLGETSTHGANFWLGSRLVVSAPVILDKFGLIPLSSGQKVKMALYSDSGGAPGALVAETASYTLASTRLEMDVADVKLAAGTYYIMAIYDSNANISYTSSSSATVWFKSYAFSSSAPSPFGTASTYGGQEFAYYLVVY